MPGKPTELSMEQFRNELIKRFFHPDSYFMHCFSHHLQTFLKDGGNSNNNEYLLIGNLLDKLVASEDVIQEIESIVALKGFEQCKEKLSKGIKCLYESDLEPEKMKIEIESIAQSMFGSMIDAFQNEESKAEIKNLLGINYSATDNLDELELQEPSSEGPGLTDPGFSVEETESRDVTPQSLIEEKDFLLPVDDGKDATPDESKVGLVEEGGSCNSARQDAALINTVTTKKRLSVCEAFQTAVEEQVDKLQNIVKLLNSERQNNSGMQECDEVFEKIIYSSMIYGFDALEEVAEKARRFLLNLRSQPDFESRLASSMLQETVKVLQATLKNGPDNVDRETISQFSKNLINSKTFLPADQEDSVAPFPSKETSHKLVVPDKNSTPAEFKLPGEDEIFSLISQISEESPLQKEMDMQLELPEESKPEVLVASVPQAEPGDPLSKYKQQAEVYFSIIDQALNILEGQPGHKTALEDVQLACNSLSDAAMKLNLDSISKIYVLMSDLIRSILNHGYSISPNEHRLIKNSFQDFRNLNSVIDSDSPEFKENIVSLQALNSKVKMSRSPRHVERTIDRFKRR